MLFIHGGVSAERTRVLLRAPLYTCNLLNLKKKVKCKRYTCIPRQMRVFLCTSNIRVLLRTCVVPMYTDELSYSQNIHTYMRVPMYKCNL